MALVTLEIGPSWRMQLLQGLLEARGFPALVQEDGLNTWLGGARPTAQLRVPEEVAAAARTAVADAERDGSLPLEGLRYRVNERFTAPQPVRALLLDVGFWLTIFLVAIWVIWFLLHEAGAV